VNSDYMVVCVRLGTCSQPQSHCLHRKAHPDHLCQIEVASVAVKKMGMQIVVAAVVNVEILWVEICAPPAVVAAVSVKEQVHHHLQLMVGVQMSVGMVELNAVQRMGHQQSIVLLPVGTPDVLEEH
jgi:hypothetical protein